MKAKWIIAAGLFLLSIIVFLAFSRKNENPQASKRCDTCGNQEESGVIEGIVVDKNNRPMPRMEVEAEPKDMPIGEFPSALTDRHGKFVIKGIRYETTYLVRAGKVKEGYPVMRGNFHNNENDFQTVTVSKGNKGFAKIVLGEKYGRISGTVKDDKGKPLSIATLRLTAAGNIPRRFGTSIEDDASFIVTVPPEPVTLEVSAEGYETVKIENINVSRGAVKKLQIRLHRTAAR